MDKASIVLGVLTALYGMYIAITLYLAGLRGSTWVTRLQQRYRRNRPAARLPRRSLFGQIR